MQNVFGKNWVRVLPLALLIAISSVVLAEIVYRDDGSGEIDTEKTFDTSLYEYYIKNGFLTDADLLEDFNYAQMQWLRLVPPGMELLTQDMGIRYFEPEGFPKEFVDGLLPVEIAGGAVVYPVIVKEDPKTRKRIFLNIKGDEIYVADPPKDYDWRWFLLEQHPDVDEKNWSMEEIAQLEDLYDPSHLALRYDLILNEDLIKYIMYLSLLPPPGGGIMKLDWEGGSVTNLQFVDIDTENTNGYVAMLVAYPDDFTNRISLIECTNLMAIDWGLLMTTNPPSTTNTFTYIDENAGNYNRRFYYAYNADYDGDGDGVSDGKETYLDDTDPDDPNDPPNVKGTVTYNPYSGGQTGLIWVVAVTASNSWSTNYSDVIAETGAYHIVNIPASNYWLKAFRDSDGDVTPDTYEAWGIYTNAAVAVTGQLTNAVIELIDPDTDADGMADWWEVEHFTNLSKIATGDEDSDTLSNLGEFLTGGDPNDTDTDDDGMGDAAEVAQGFDIAVSNEFTAFPYSENFESFAQGVLNNQGGWVCTPTNSIVVQTNVVNGGTQAVEFLVSTNVPTADQFIAAKGETNVWIDFYAKTDPRSITYFDDYPDITQIPAYQPSVFAINYRGEVWAYDGAEEAWTNDSRFVITEYQWHRFTVKENYNNHTWDLFVDSIRVFSGIGFRQWLEPYASNTVDIVEFSRFTMAAARGGAWYIDDISIGTTQPSGLYGDLQTDDIRVAADTDDAEQLVSDGSVTTINDLDIGYNDANTRIVGIRFINLGIAPTSLVRNAYIQFTEDSDNDKTQECPVKIESQAHDNAPTFVASTTNISSRAVTDYDVPWSVPSWPGLYAADIEQRSSEIAVLVQDVVLRPGWQSNNSMVFIITSTQSVGNRREADNYSGAPNNGPLLHVEWAEPLQ